MTQRTIGRIVGWVALAIIMTVLLYASGFARASSEALPVVHKRCAFVQGGKNATFGDLNLYRRTGTAYAAVKKVCWDGAKGETGATGATGATGPAGPAGADGADANIGLPVCASNGGNLKLCGGDNGHDPVGYLVAAEG